MATVAPVDWDASRAALADMSARVTTLLRSGPDPGTPALGVWSVSEVATHLSHAFARLAELAGGDAPSPLERYWDLGEKTRGWVDADPERRLPVLADRIEAGAAAFLDRVPAGGADASRHWLVEGTDVPLSTLTCHLLNESMVHGFDIARAVRRPWPLERAYASMVLLGFVVPVVRRFAAEMINMETAAHLRASFEVRLRGGGGAVFVFDNGSLVVEDPGQRVDCRVTADPEAFLLVVWNRISQWQAIARGKLVATGRKPWLGLRFRSAFLSL
ncbi:MAG: maleylpyruvate isomerase N-terminal domain-containing protein [Acidimicrobiales bacterium]